MISFFLISYISSMAYFKSKSATDRLLSLVRNSFAMSGLRLGTMNTDNMGKMYDIADKYLSRLIRKIFLNPFRKTDQKSIMNDIPEDLRAFILMNTPEIIKASLIGINLSCPIEYVKTLRRPGMLEDMVLKFMSDAVTGNNPERMIDRMDNIFVLDTGYVVVVDKEYDEKMEEEDNRLAGIYPMIKE
jgi:hypothetical protein